MDASAREKRLAEQFVRHDLLPSSPWPLALQSDACFLAHRVDSSQREGLSIGNPAGNKVRHQWSDESRCHAHRQHHHRHPPRCNKPCDSLFYQIMLKSGNNENKPQHRCGGRYTRTRVAKEETQDVVKICKERNTADQDSRVREGIKKGSHNPIRHLRHLVLWPYLSCYMSEIVSTAVYWLVRVDKTGSCQL